MAEWDESEIVPPFAITWAYSPALIKKYIGNMRRKMQKQGDAPNTILIVPEMSKLLGEPQQICGLRVVVEAKMGPEIAFWLCRDTDTFVWGNEK